MYYKYILTDVFLGLTHSWQKNGLKLGIRSLSSPQKIIFPD